MTTTNDENGDKTLRWGDYEVSPSDVPATSLMALAQRGFTHVLGNEVASALTAWKKTEEGASAPQAAVVAWVKAKRDAKLEQIMQGTLGVRAAGQPRASGIEAIMRSIAVERLKVKLAKRQAKLPSGDKTINVAGKDMTREELISAELRHGEKVIRAEAEAEMAKRAAFAQEVGEDLFAD